MSTTATTLVLDEADTDVLYLDYENDVHPLSNIYHATASNHLTSSTTTIQHIEIDSTYCPQCLSCQPFIGSRSETQSYCNTSPHYCKQCPICHIPLRVSCRPSTSASASSSEQEEKQTLVITYQCGYCRYDSGLECGIESSYDDGSTTTTDSKNLVLAEELHKSFLQQTNNDSKTNEAKTFNALVQGWKHKVENDANMKSLQQFQMRGNIVFKPAAPQETIEKAPLKDKQYSSSTCYRTDSILTQQEFQTYYQESSKYYSHDKDSSQQLVVPQRISLIPRVSKRDPLEVSKGKPGLLMKPKLNILDGDSSQRRYGNYGQWFKKDCSAVHTIPKLSLVKQQQEVQNNHTAFLMKLHNPTMGRIRIRFGVITLESDDSTTFIRKNVLLDGYQRNVLKDIELVQPINNSSSSPPVRLTSDWMEVDQSEGALGGLGIDHLASVGTTTTTASSSTTADGNENMVQSWNGTNILNAMMTNKDPCLFQTNLIKQDGDVIWFECAIRTTMSQEGSNQHSKGTMFTLHVQSLEEGGVAASGAGNNDDEDGDYMKIHLLVPWRKEPQNE